MGFFGADGEYVHEAYDHIDEFRLLISCSEQSPYEHFTQSLIDLEVDMSMNYIKKAQEMGFPIKDVNREEIHILSNAHFSCVFEMILHDVPKQRAIEMSDRFSAVFAAGWKECLSMRCKVGNPDKLGLPTFFVTNSLLIQSQISILELFYEYKCVHQHPLIYAP